VDDVTKQCCRLLQQGWTSIDVAMVALPYLAGLQEDGLLGPLRGVQRVVADVLLGLCGSLSGLSGGSSASGVLQRQWGLPRPSTAGAHATGARPPSAPPSARARDAPISAGTGAAVLERGLNVWSHCVRTSALLAEAQLLSPEGLSSANDLLEVELRRLLRGASVQELGRAVAKLAEGIKWLECCMTQPQEGFLPPFGSRARSVITGAFALAEQLEQGPEAASARAALEGRGLLECVEAAAAAAAAALVRPSSAAAANRARQRARPASAGAGSGPHFRTAAAAGATQRPSTAARRAVAGPVFRI